MEIEIGLFVRELSSGYVPQDDGGTVATALGLSFIRHGNNANAFSKLSHYETNLERSLYKALHELQRLPGRSQR